MTSEKHQPFEQNMMKEEKVMAQNIEGHSDEVGLHTGTRIKTKSKKKKLPSMFKNWSFFIGC